MDASQSLFALATYGFATSITPGPNNLMLLTSGTNYGVRRSLPHMLGVTLGFVFMIAVVGSGLGLVLRGQPMVMEVLKWVSIIYLVYLAWRTATAPVDLGAADASHGKPLTFFQACAFQWVNPKAWTMALTSIAVFVPAGSGFWGLVPVMLVFGAVNLPSCFTWLAAGAQLRRFLGRPRILRAFNIGAALLLLGSLALSFD